MGTSTSHRSPATPEWDRVRDLYRQPNPDPGAIASRIVSALSPAARSEMAGPGVALCLGSLVNSSRRIAEGGLQGVLGTERKGPGGPPLLRLAQALREGAERHITATNQASRWAEIGLNALGTAVMEAGAGNSASVLQVPEPEIEEHLGCFLRDRRLHELAKCFLAHDFDHLFRYFVTRDISDFIGSEALPTVAAGSQLRDAVTLFCRQKAAVVAMDQHEPALQQAAALAPDEALSVLKAPLGALIEAGLRSVETGG